MAGVFADGPDAMRGWMSKPWPEGPLDEEIRGTRSCRPPGNRRTYQVGRPLKIGGAVQWLGESTCRLPAAGPYRPPAASHRRESFMTRRHRGFTHVHPSGLPQPVTPGWDRSPRALPRASHPAVTRSARQGGDSPLRTGPETTSPTSADPPSTRSTHRMRPRVARHP
jgi:hypothetical protein